VTKKATGLKPSFAIIRRDRAEAIVRDHQAGRQRGGAGQAGRHTGIGAQGVREQEHHPEQQDA
jgi:hypothetical protein